MFPGVLARFSGSNAESVKMLPSKKMASGYSPASSKKHDAWYEALRMDCVIAGLRDSYFGLCCITINFKENGGYPNLRASMQLFHCYALF